MLYMRYLAHILIIMHTKKIPDTIFTFLPFEPEISRRKKCYFFFISYFVPVFIEPDMQAFQYVEDACRLTWLKSTFHHMHHFSSMKIYGILPVMRDALVATLHWTRYLLLEQFYFSRWLEGNWMQEDEYPSMPRGFPQGRHLFCFHKEDTIRE